LSPFTEAILLIETTPTSSRRRRSGGFTDLLTVAEGHSPCRKQAAEKTNRVFLSATAEAF
jgi:hypothetical protein